MTPGLMATTPGGLLLVLAVVVPVIGILALWLVRWRAIEWVAIATLAINLVVSLATLQAVRASDASLVYLVGGWMPPLGLALRADGIAAVMMVMTGAIVAVTALYARGQFGFDPHGPERRRPMVFWTMLLAITGALNLIFVGEDLFNLYVALELLTFAAVPLVSLDGSRDTLAAALRYLVFALAGSVLYLLGVAVVYGAYGTLDLVVLAEMRGADGALLLAIALMTAGLIAKTALFPLHLWLPPAHAGAPAAASAILSALVVKGSFFLILGLWFDLLPPGLGAIGANGLGMLGAGAVIVGSVLALRQERLKLLVAYSTVAQIGYLFLVFPLATGSEAASPFASLAWTGGVLQLLAHAFAKAAMFMAAGLVYEAIGHDRIAGFKGLGRIAPITVLTMTLASVSLMGLPPSGGFSAKWLMLSAALGEGAWWWAVVILAGGLLAAGYVFRILVPAFSTPEAPAERKYPVAPVRECAALVLAVIAILIGFLPLAPWPLLAIGRIAQVSP
ncbi:multisubunit sodium/proton antiporter, MrpD subunit [Kaistia soli DSM 19436]|uniref:Multisubunit sodium/proton antiporter, MrpD subunit n=1 Tax=Kaistia soli DSM 19436 TaxID=1122133 RepID=A0A1M5GFI4_9HYPH|nr:proton-conducting transporter membrane subunit [Kaistia soli]SHG02477.1 multisubunit sodium/proton antiporter, MrpD subunit [Kaistia soli DSM 19436]